MMNSSGLLRADTRSDLRLDAEDEAGSGTALWMFRCLSSSNIGGKALRVSYFGFRALSPIFTIAVGSRQLKGMTVS